VQETSSDGTDLQEISLETFLCTEEDKAHQELEIFGKRFVVCFCQWCMAFMFIPNIIDCQDISCRLWCSWEFQLSITLFLSLWNGQLKGGMISTCFHMPWKPVLTQEMWRDLRRFRLCTRKVCCYWKKLYAVFLHKVISLLWCGVDKCDRTSLDKLRLLLVIMLSLHL